MVDLYRDRLLEQLSILTPYIVYILGFVIWCFILVALTRGAVYRNLFSHPKIVSEIVKENIRQRDAEIKQLKRDKRRLQFSNSKLLLAMHDLIAGISGEKDIAV